MRTTKRLRIIPTGQPKAMFSEFGDALGDSRPLGKWGPKSKKRTTSLQLPRCVILSKCNRWLFYICVCSLCVCTWRQTETESWCKCNVLPTDNCT